MPSFEFDPQKSAANHAKHGIDFIEAQALWTDPARVERGVVHPTELRSQVIGRIGAVMWSAFITYRHDSIRLISVRHARQSERDLYARSRDSHR
ncbi:MAG TPA: BrnT family toxin [Burkholderiales bacterium]|nr:BrnT family toxin [Burkholderiales bacterium]